MLGRTADIVAHMLSFGEISGRQAINNPKFQGGGDARLGPSTFGTIASQAGFLRAGQFLIRLFW
jgi:hypothetical protein